jgi:ElaB/YqjD/DUF883 family membrane-anchored ribosome-binding protein
MTNRFEVKAMDTQDERSRTQEQLIGDLRLVIENAEALLKNTDRYTSVLYQDARARLAVALTVANDELSRCEEAQLDRMIGTTQAASLEHADTSGEARILRAFY